MSKVNRNFKASVFTHLFGEPAKEFELYNAICPGRFPPDTPVTDMTLSDVLYKDRLSDSQYTAALNELMGWSIISDDIRFSDLKIEMSGKNAKASIVESYTYYINDGFSGESFRRKMYTFVLEYSGEDWLITNIFTDDPWEIQPTFVYKAIDVEAEIARLDEENQSVLASNVSEEMLSIQEMLNQQPSRNLYQWNYSTSKAVAYAVANYANTSIPPFDTYTDNCQNFASQCVWAGLGGLAINGRLVRPAVDLIGNNQWRNTREITDPAYMYNEFYFNWPWDNVRGFAKRMIVTSTMSNAEGPFGYATYSNGIQNSGLAQVLTVAWSGTPSEHNLDHAMFTTEVLGTFGSRTTSEVKISAHTSPTNTAYETVASYTNASINNFGITYVSHGYYYTPQP